MSTALRHTWAITVRHLLELWRQPWYIGISLVQPVIWLLLFGTLFARVVEIPGFASDNYADFLTPGIVVMTALFGAGWCGMGVIQDLDRGILDRFLVSPVWRGALISGRLVQVTIVTVIQSLIVIGMGVLVGFQGNVIGIVVMILCASLLGWTVGACSIGIALLARKEETLIGSVNIVMLPLTFLSSTFMQQDLVSGWISAIATVNPVNWAVYAGRVALAGGAGVTSALLPTAGLLILALLGTWFATRAFRTYQRSV